MSTKKEARRSNYRDNVCIVER